MPFVGNINLGPAGAPEPARNADRAKEARERRKAAKPASTPLRDEDEADLSAVANVEPSEGLRSVKGNDQQESRQDRTSHGYYTLRNAAPLEERPHLDVSG